MSINVPDKYLDVIQSLDPEGNLFKPAKTSEISKLKHLQLPDSVLEFFYNHAPCDVIENETEEPIRLQPVSGIVEENSDYVPGCDISPQGFIVFATTIYGDTYCFDLKANPTDPPVLLIGHEISYEGASVDDIRKNGVPAAINLYQFLERFRDNTLVIDPYDKK